MSKNLDFSRQIPSKILTLKILHECPIEIKSFYTPNQIMYAAERRFFYDSQILRTVGRIFFPKGGEYVNINANLYILRNFRGQEGMLRGAVRFIWSNFRIPFFPFKSAYMVRASIFQIFMTLGKP